MMSKSLFTHILPGGRGVRQDASMIDQREAWQRRGKDVNIPVDNTPHASMHISSSAATAVTAGTYVKVAGTTILDDGFYFDMPANNRLRYRHSNETHFMVQVNTTFTADVNNTEVYMRLAKNGSTVEITQIDRKVGTANDIGAAATGGLFALGWSDYLELWVNADKNSNVTFSKMSFMVIPYIWNKVRE